MLDSIDPFYQSVNTRCVDDNNPTLIKTRMEGGVTFIVKSSILKYVECIELDENRITGIEIPTLNSERIFCFCVYLPATSKSFEYFRTYVERLYDIYSVYSEMRTVYILCDLNVKVNGPRLTSIVTDKRFELFEHCLNEFNLVSLHLQPFGVDSTYTFQSYEDGPTTSIDHILLSNDYICQVNSGRVIDDHSFNVFDHHPIIVEVKIDQNMDVESETIPISDKVAWGKAR
jgi:exonuclease III